MRMSLAIVSICTTFLAFIIIVFWWRMNQVIYAIDANDRIMAGIVRDAVIPALRIMIAYVILLGVLVGVVSVMLSHKIYGPLVPLLRHVKALKEGSYASRVHLRATDEMGELATALNELAETLEARK
jgi:signal transduction histidine kinase